MADDQTTNVEVSTSNISVVSNTTVIATIPVSMVNGILSNLDVDISTAKATLDADILAAQVKAKSTVSAYVTTAKAALADIEAWIEETPGEIQIAASTISKILQEIKTVEGKIIADTENIASSISPEIKTIAADAVAGAKGSVSVFGKLWNWWKAL